MDAIKKDINKLLDVVSKEPLKIKHRRQYYEIVQRYSDVANDDETLLKDLKPLDELINKLHESFRV